MSSDESDIALPGLFSTSPDANFVSQDGPQESNQSESVGSVSYVTQGDQIASILNAKSEPWNPDAITADETVQLIKLFKEKLLFTAPVLVPNDFADAESLADKHPNLAACIVYVTSRYVPGYQGLREALTPSISLFLQSALATRVAGPEEEMANMQAFIILYIHSRSNAFEISPVGTAPKSNINFWSIKASCEAYAMHIHLYRAVDDLQLCWRSQSMPNRTDRRVRLYLMWLWLFTTCHKYSFSEIFVYPMLIINSISIVTTSPPTINVDSSIRTASMLLESLRSNNDVFLILAEVELCLLWYKLSRKDPSIGEWWCSTSIRSLPTHDSPCVSFGDIDEALSGWWRRTMHGFAQGDFSENVTSLSPEYYFHYTRSCLNTYFVQHISSVNPKPCEVEAIRKCMDAAKAVLTIARQVGPMRRDQLRYCPGLLFLTLSHCYSMFTFPDHPSRISTECLIVGSSTYWKKEKFD